MGGRIRWAMTSTADSVRVARRCPRRQTSPGFAGGDMSAEHPTVTHDLEILANYVASHTSWLSLALRDEMAYELRHPTAETLIFNVALLVEDRATPPGPLAAARRLDALIEV